MAKKRRSRFWIVSTHVVTAGFAIPLLVGFIAAVLVAQAQLTGMEALIPVMALLLLAYVGGTYYSLSYLAKTAVSDAWNACTKPAIITVAILNVLGCVVDCLRSTAGIALVFLFILYHAALVFLFAVITSRGFARLAAESAASEAESPSPPATP